MMTESVLEHESHKDGHKHAHPPYLQHHFDTAEQQYEAGKIGMWLFLATEILLFGGLFCAYSVYRGNHPEIFIYAHRFLDVPLGALNTAVLIFSSFTMAWGVRLSQRGKRTGLNVCLIITLLCGFTFMSVKYVEYKHKWEHGLLWGKLYQSQEVHHGEAGEALPGVEPAVQADSTPVEPPPAEVAASAPAENLPELSQEEKDRTKVPMGAEGPPGIILQDLDPGSAGAEHQMLKIVPKNVHIFFGIYFLMTGLHGLHVLVGMIAISWILVRSFKGHFGPEYYTPVDLVGLYWHLVDLIWIYLFPLLYLIR